MKKISYEGVIAFLNLNPLDQVLYALHVINCRTSAWRFYIAIKLIKLCAWLDINSVGNWIGNISGLSKRLFELNPELARQRDED